MDCAYPIADPGPPRWSASERAWIVSRYADAVRALKSPDLAVIEAGPDLRRLSARLGGELDVLIGLIEGSHPFQNPPAHDAARADARNAVADMLRQWPAERMQAFVDERLSAAPRGEALDAVALLADALPRAVAAETLGLETDALHRLGPHARALASIWEAPNRSLREIRAIRVSAELLGKALGAADDAPLRAFLMTAGIEASAGLIGSAVHLLSKDQDLQARLRREPSSVPAFVEETLRVFPPLRRVLARVSRGATEIGGTPLSDGAWVVVDLESANRDPEVYPDPGRFDMDRGRAPVVAFGAGPHACVGSALARLEAKVAISRLLAHAVLLPGEGETALRSSRDWRVYAVLPVILAPLA